mmetsp:Transcript_124883/g.296330  ORF Transcript_124883/g.296330 Transcript_124883/m.296330 type:complete len:241 (+) Transcript_124883:49-771(+)
MGYTSFAQLASPTDRRHFGRCGTAVAGPNVIGGETFGASVRRVDSWCADCLSVRVPQLLHPDFVSEVCWARPATLAHMELSSFEMVTCSSGWNLCSSRGGQGSGDSCGSLRFRWARVVSSGASWLTKIEVGGPEFKDWSHNPGRDVSMSTSTLYSPSSHSSGLPSEAALRGDPLRGEFDRGDALRGEFDPRGDPLGEACRRRAGRAGRPWVLLAAALRKLRRAPCPWRLRCFHSQRFLRM